MGIKGVSIHSIDGHIITFGEEISFCPRLTSFFDHCADKLINGIKDGNLIKQLKASLNAELASLNKQDYDTGENGFNGKEILKQPDILPLLHLSNALNL